MAIPTKKKKNRRLLWILLGLVGILLVAAIFVRNSRPKGEKVTVMDVELRTITETVSASGKVFPETEVNISSDVSGEIVELYVEEGDSVLKGEILLRVDPDSYESAVERGEASVNNAKAQLANSVSGIKRSEAGVYQAEAQVQQIEAQLENARNIHERNIQLLQQGVISQADFDASLSTLKSTEANLTSSKANLNSTKATLESSKESSNASRFNVKSAEASLKELKTSLRRTTIYAPMSGVVSSLSVELGERVVGTIQMTGTEIMRIANLDLMEVQVDVSENDVLRVSIEDEVDIEIDAYLDKKFSGRVSQIANSATGSGTAAALSTDQVTNFIVKILIDRESYKNLVVPGKPFPFRPGMSASVDIKTKVAADVISVPIQAVASRVPKKEKSDDEDKDAEVQTVSDTNEDEDKEVVFIVDGDKAKMVIVTTGIQDDEYIEITSGLSKDDQIISGPYAAVARKLEDGKIIQIVDEDKLYSSED
ncbi:MAG: efflux RND transporter periplasmic adaptor subunit [Bacteroidia bacterium]|nr:efflux RND transporter periplasmic adaptor subunit [Bacteroidia bacterium]